MKCENCGGSMRPYLARQRFCCRACSDAWFQAKRRQAVEWFRAAGLTVERPFRLRDQFPKVLYINLQEDELFYKRFKAVQ